MKIFTIIISIVAITGWSLVSINLAQGAVESNLPFDYSQCQYPSRATNPPNGCDNSDPACPLEIKGGTCENYNPTPIESEPTEPVKDVKISNTKETCNE